ncbi:MAG: MBL fold metallo-hydrolase [Pyrinomonadaceae bacterium]|nr:MBL fold metallo-hydrolase [Pyrinomonadaceae bacterium]
MIVNVLFVGQPNAGDSSWVLVDAGLYGSANRIKHAAEERYGPGARPQAIILTHGHFDHVGALEELATGWDVPIYAHETELPYLTGGSAYPPPDPSVGGGAMARLSWMYPRGPINLGGRVRPLPTDGSVPGMPGWRWVHTPGHTAGHVSFFRESDRTLIAGDAFVTVKQESALAVLTQRPEMNGPPKYYTSDWQAARGSVEKLAGLQPSIVATGHGVPMRGAQMQQQLQELARNFDRLAVPAHGRYVEQPAITNERGVVSVPPPISDPLPKVLAGVGLAALAGAALILTSRRKAPTNKRKRRYRTT